MVRAALKQLPTFINTVFAKKYKDPLKYHDFAVDADRIKQSEDIANRLAELLPKGGIILDLAAGTGIVSKCLVEKDFKVWATDHDSRMLEQIDLGNNVQVKDLDYNVKFNFENNTFDGATILWGNRYISNIDHFLAELYRVMKSGGVFLWPVFALEMPLWMTIGKPEKIPTPKNLIVKAEKAGFRVTQIKQPNPATTKVPGYLILQKP